MRRLRPLTLGCSLLFVTAAAVAAERDSGAAPRTSARPRLGSPSRPSPLHVSGYYKHLFVSSKSLTTAEGLTSNLHRLRLDLKADLSEAWKAHVAADQELLLHDAARTSDFDLVRQKNQRRQAFWDADHASIDDDHLYLRHAVYRATVTYDRAPLKATVGKQKLDWGRSRFFSPTDLFNPISPLDLEQEERIGVDAVSAEWAVDPQTTASGVYAPRQSVDDTKLGVRLYRGLGVWDLFVLAGTFEKDEVAGATLDGQVGEAGLRAEGTVTRADDGHRFLRAALGAEYHFPNKVSVLTEYFYNGGADDNRQAEFLNSYAVGSRLRSLEPHLAGVWVRWEPMPLLKWEATGIYDVDGESAFLNPAIRYEPRQNLELVAGVQLFWGREASEFGSYHPVYYLQGQWFF